jgi:3-oxo-4-pregnene-20-carboxyl-CoA dehydrogenase alpha subunit
MDFDLDESQQEVARLAAQTLSRDKPDQWRELAQAGLLALSLPRQLGGDGLGFLDTAVLLTEIGRRPAQVPAPVPAQVPALGTLTCMQAIVRWGDAALQRALLPAAAAGETILSIAIREPGDPFPAHPATTADAAITGTAISGTKLGVPYAAEASRVLVAVGFPDGRTGMVLADPSGDGVTVTRTHTVTGEPEYTVTFDHAPVVHTLAAPDARELYRLATAAACCLADGALAGALALTTAHVASRRQFGRALAEFQAVSQQIADVCIASRTLHLITLSACWRLATGRDADDDLDTATWWVTEEAARAVATCHHLHGGIGVDVSYPLPRFSGQIRDLARFLGGAGVH